MKKEGDGKGEEEEDGSEKEKGEKYYLCVSSSEEYVVT